MMAKVEVEKIKTLITTVSRLDLGEPVPTLDELFLSVWAEHYARILSLAQPFGDSVTLEVGLGYGIVALALAGVGEKVVSTEHPSRAYLFKHEYRELLEGRGVELVANDLGDGLPFASGVFNKVLYCDVIEHLFPEMLEGQVRELHRVLQPGGLLILSTPNLARLWNRVAFLRGRPVNPPLRVRRVGKTYDHIREYQWEELVPLFEGVGFRIERVEYGWIPHFNGENPKCAWNRITEWLLPLAPALGDEFYVRMVRV